MEFYEVIEKRKTIRDFTGEPVGRETIQRILDAGLKAPTNDHMRDWHFAVIDDPALIQNLIKKIPKKVSEKRVDFIMKVWRLQDECQKKMYADAIPKQYQMLLNSGCLVIPLFKQKKNLLQPKNLSDLNGFASIWCCIENIFLAATAEGCGCTLRIPLGDEKDHVKSILDFPGDYEMPCYIAIGKPAKDGAYYEQNICDVQERIHLNKW